jgi:hypothetical protein
LPRPLVANHLESIDPKICARFIEYLIDERGEESSVFHDRLAELYLKMTLNANKHGDEGLFPSEFTLQTADRTSQRQGRLLMLSC